MPATNQPERERITLVHTEVFISHKTGKLTYEYAKLPDDWESFGALPEDLERIVFSKPLMSGRPGFVFSIETNGDGSVFTKTTCYLGLWPGKEDRIRWQTTSDANRTLYRTRKNMKKEVSASMPKEALDPIREAYAASSWERRTLILAEVIRYITG